jgi:hypothetical protein
VNGFLRVLYVRSLVFSPLFGLVANGASPET